MKIEVGSPYFYLGDRVVAMEKVNRGRVAVRRIDRSVPVIEVGRAMSVNVDDLKPAPLRYLGGATARG